MIFEQLDGDFGVGQEFYVVVKLAGGNGAGAFFFYFGTTRSAQAQVEVGGSDGQAVAGGFHRHKVRPPEKLLLRATSSTKLISNAKPIKPAVTVGGSQKWKTGATRL